MNYRILFLSTSMGMGGADQQILSLANVLRRRGHEISIVSLTALGPMGERARADGLPCVSLQMRRGLPDPRGLARLRKLLGSFRPDILHSHMMHANLMARSARMFGSVPILINTAHNITEGRPWMEWCFGLTDRIADLTTNVSQAGVDRYVQIGAAPARRICCVPNGLDTGKFQFSAGGRSRVRAELGINSEFLWLAVGRFEVAKDYPTMLNAFHQVVAADKDKGKKPWVGQTFLSAIESASGDIPIKMSGLESARGGQECPPLADSKQTRMSAPPIFPPSPKGTLLALAGTGSLLGAAESQVASLALRDRVRFLGVRTDVRDLLCAADGYVMSSAWEGMPIVLLEASAAGLPIVATDVGGNPEVVLNNRTGLLVPPHDPSALAGAMLKLMSMTAGERSAMGNAGKAYIGARHDISSVVDQWERIYGELFMRKGIRSMPKPTNGDRF